MKAHIITHRPTLAVALGELSAWLSASAARFASLRDFAAKARTDVACDIAADVSRAAADVSRSAHSAETHDREALRLLDCVLADGHVSPLELAALRQARALTARSADTDHAIAEATHLAP